MDPKGILKALALELRHELEGRYDAQGKWQPGDLERRLAGIGVRRDRTSVPLDELPHLPAEDCEARRVVDAFIESHAEAGQNREEAVAEFVREAAYTWANRLLALRCMEARGLIDEIILQKDAYGGKSLQHHRLARKQPGRCSGKDEGLFAALFDEFERRAGELPLLFDPKAPEVALLPSTAALKRCVALLSGTEAVKGRERATDAVFTAPDSLGWAYQYWNIEEKDRVFEKVRTKKGAKIEGAEIIAATCIYTEPYMVKFLVQNSLGALWIGMHPESRLFERWEYYVRDAERAPVERKPVGEITFLDPSCGSGHFLIEAFDLLYEMYQEEGGVTDPAEICASILENNLYGTDIDERAIQIAALALYIKAKEKASNFSPRRVNLVAANVRLAAGKEHLEGFLRKHPDDVPLKPALLAIFEGLAHADELGSLLQIEQPVEKELRYLREREPLLAAATEWAEWERGVLERLRGHFAAEANAPDLGAAFFGEGAGKGLSLVDLFTRRYDVVATNPPYMGSKNMGEVVKNHLERYFPAGKRDVYAAFILRCLSLAANSGRVAMVTQQAWMFLHFFSDLRCPAVAESKQFPGLLNATSVEVLAHLGPRAFNEVSGEVVSTVLFALAKGLPKQDHRIAAIRATEQSDPVAKAKAVASAAATGSATRHLQSSFNAIPGSPLVYWLDDELLGLLQRKECFASVLKTKQGIVTGNNARFLRFHWENPNPNLCRPYMKGLGFARWYGYTELSIDWLAARPRIAQFKVGRVKQPADFQRPGWTYSSMAQGAMSPRVYEPGWLYDNRGPVVFPKPSDLSLVGAILASRFGTMLLRAITQGNDFNSYHVDRLPLWIERPPISPDGTVKWLVEAAKWRCRSKPPERLFRPEKLQVRDSIGESWWRLRDEELAINAAALTLEAHLDSLVFNAYRVSLGQQSKTFAQLGKPAGAYPLHPLYSAPPPLPDGMAEPPGFSETPTISSTSDYSNGQTVLIERKLYELCEKPNSVREDESDGQHPSAEEEEEAEPPEHPNSLAERHLPSETFFEEVARKLEIHAISAYWLLRDGRLRGTRICADERHAFGADWIAVCVLQLLGHRWPLQIEAKEAMPQWADIDGIIPITEGTEEPSVLSRACERIAADFGPDRVGAVQREFEEIMGVTLADWLGRGFFLHHVSQFRKRPIAWQIQSQLAGDGKRGRRGARRRPPAFSCLVYYHRLDADLLPKLRTHYVGSLRSRLQTELNGLEKLSSRTADQDARRYDLEESLDELKAFDEQLEKVIVGGFESNALDELAPRESLDRWTSRDGSTPAPASLDAFLAQEQKYDPDLNDGVRVNVAPLQHAGLLAADVLAAKDVEKAIADRAEWRADERRWCREGKLPRPGWWPAL